MTNPEVGYLEDVGEPALVCAVCDHVEWERRYKDGDDCPKCADGVEP